MISVAIPTYQGAAFIGPTLQSVLDQTHRDLEIILSDDASKDDTVRIAESFGDARIKIFRHESNLGPMDNWNFALAQCQGEYIKVMGQDDLIHPSCLEKQQAILSDPAHASVGLVTCRREVVNAEGKKILTRGFDRKSPRWPGAQALAASIRAGGNLLGEPVAGLFRKSDIDRGVRFRDKVPYFIDIDFWGQLMADRDLYSQPEALCSFRVSNSAWSAALMAEQSQQWQKLLDLLDESYPNIPLSRLGWWWGRTYGNLHYGILRKIFYKIAVR